MHKKFKINRTKIKGGFQSGRKVITHDSHSDLPLVVISTSSHMQHSTCSAGVLLGYYRGTTATAVLIVRPKKGENLE